MEFLNNREGMQQRFFISVRKADKLLSEINKIEIPLDPSKNIVKQAEEISGSLLDSLGIPENSRSDISWKIFRNQGKSYGMVTKSINWNDEE